MYTPASIGGLKFSKCLVDTGSEANVISIGDVIKHELSFLPGGVHELRDFDNQEVPIQGSFTSHVIVGLVVEPKEVVFLCDCERDSPHHWPPHAEIFCTQG